MVRIGIAAAAALLLLVGTGIAPAADSRVDIAVEAMADGNGLAVSGSATVPDGAWIVFAARRLAPPLRRVRGAARASGGHYAGSLDISGWPAGTVAVDAHFQVLLPGDLRQPPEVIARYGANGERMTGPSVVEGGGGFRAAIASTGAELR
ncbi:hypothetical protein ACFOGJ_25170 [Marinibaculum pumilum]|uniref:Uncharacterized protein n=1 Tax=Marinibaculum pumilum TaxID=1766165 RepID=A0ABV7L7G4_9PROT